MTMNTNTNPSAFPREPGYGSKGMTIRDYFAGQALQGLLAKYRLANITTNPLDLTYKDFTNMAYDAADEMLLVRQNPIKA